VQTHDFNVTENKPVPSEFQLGYKFLQMFGTNGPIVDTPEILRHPYEGIPQRNRLFMSVFSRDVDSVKLYYRGINNLENEFLLSPLINHLYYQYWSIQDGLILSIPVKKPAKKAANGKDLVHAMQLVFNEYVTSKKHITAANSTTNSIKEDSFLLYNNDGVSKEGLTLPDGRTTFLRDIHDFIVNQGKYKNNPQDINIRYKYARYFLILIADQLKAGLLENKLPVNASIPSVVEVISAPVTNIFEMFLNKSNSFYNQFTLPELYKMIGFIGLFLYYHLKLGQSFQNDTVILYNLNEKKPKNTDSNNSKRRQRQKLSAELYRLGYYGMKANIQSKLLIGAMQIENYLLHYFNVKEEFMPNKEFDKINQRLLNFAPVLCKAS